MTRPYIQVRTYDQGSVAASGTAFQADATGAIANGYAITSQVWSGTALTVTYQLQGPPPKPPAPKQKTTPAQWVAGALLLLVGLAVIGATFGKQDGSVSGGGAPGAMATPAAEGQLSLSAVSVTDRVIVGDPVQVRFHATNAGSGVDEMVMRIGGASGKAEFQSCQPSCIDQDEILGTRYLDFPDLRAGGAGDYTLTYRTLEVGHIDWEVSPKGQPEELWAATTVVAP